jgi:hypothetical protein
MMRRSVVARISCYAFLPLAGLVLSALDGAVMAGPRVLTSSVAIRHCIKPEPETLRALRANEALISISVNALNLGNPPSGRFIVSLQTGRDGPFTEITRFAVHPLRAFSSSEASKQQRFAISLAEHVGLMNNNDDLCFEVGFAQVDHKISDAMAEIELEITDLSGVKRN